MNNMRMILKCEELALFVLSIYALYDMHVQWWVYLLLFLGPDISMLGYAAGNRAGAVTYNLFHHKGIAVVFFIAGLSVPYSQAHRLLKHPHAGGIAWIAL